MNLLSRVVAWYKRLTARLMARWSQSDIWNETGYRKAMLEIEDN